jgi:hypothetical protein
MLDVLRWHVDEQLLHTPMRMSELLFPSVMRWARRRHRDVHGERHVVVGRMWTGHLAIDTVEMEGTCRRVSEAPLLR